MACMSDNDKLLSRDFSESSQLNYCILDSVLTCHKTPQVSYFSPGSLEDTDKHIEVADGHNVTAKQNVQVRIKMCDDNGDPFITIFHNVLLVPDLCNRLFYIITLMNLGHTCLFSKGFCTM